MMRLATLTILSVVLATVGSAADWTRFRGPNGAGISDATTVPVQWGKDDYNWVADLPGPGHSSPVIFGSSLYVTCCDESASERSLICLDTQSGIIRWSHDVSFSAYKKHKNNSFASGTPCVDEKHVYVLWQSREASPLMALNHDGTLVWSIDLGPYLHGQGGATSPIVFGDMVVLSNDQKDPSFLLAVDRNTGKERWRIPRQGKRACYSTPCIRTSGAQNEIVFTHCYEGIIGVNPATGKQNWHIDVFGRSSQRALGSPVLAGDLVIATSGAVGGDRQLVAVRPARGSLTETTEVYRTTRQTPHVPTPLVFNGRLFLVSDQGIASCLDAATGEEVWKARLGGNYFSSPVCVAARIYCVDLDGDIRVFAAADEFKLLGTSSLGETSRATPAVSNGVLFLRTESRVFSVGG